VKQIAIIESHGKIGTLGRALGRDWTIIATAGHVRELPRDEMAIRIDDDFEPQFEPDETKSDIIGTLQDAVRHYSIVHLATDPDREGEGIAWHICELLDLDADAVVRVDLGEMTPEGITRAFAASRKLSPGRIDSYLARRVLDRLIGYTVSPWLHGTVNVPRSGVASAGRVQSPALRLLCDREREIAAFVPCAYWAIEADFELRPGGSRVKARLTQVEPEGAVATISSAETSGLMLSDPDVARQSLLEVRSRAYRVRHLDIRTVKESPPLPFNTSLLLQAAADELGFAPARTMSVAQELFEGIDETNITKDHCLLYELIWTRFLSSQMAASASEVATLEIESDQSTDGEQAARRYVFTVAESRLEFPGYHAVRGVARAAPRKEAFTVRGAPVALLAALMCSHQTQPPARYTQGDLIGALRDLGIGRPGTYATCVDTLCRHLHASLETEPSREQPTLRPTALGESIVEALAAGCPEVIDLQLTRRLEEDLDRVMTGHLEWRRLVGSEYHRWIHRHTGQPCPDCGAEMRVRRGKRGPFWGCTRYPECEGTRDMDRTARAALPPPASPAISLGCRACRDSGDPDWTFCPHCGRRIPERGAHEGQ
jgi:DNA topoisomerase-1